MKNCLSIIVFLFCLVIYGQSPRKIKHDLKAIDSIKQLDEFKLSHPNWQIELVVFEKPDALLPEKLHLCEKYQVTKLLN